MHEVWSVKFFDVCIYVLIYFASILLEFIDFVTIRISERSMDHAFRVHCSYQHDALLVG